MFEVLVLVMVEHIRRVVADEYWLRGFVSAGKLGLEVDHTRLSRQIDVQE